MHIGQWKLTHGEPDLLGVGEGAQQPVGASARLRGDIQVDGQGGGIGRTPDVVVGTGRRIEAGAVALGGSPVL